MRTSVGLVFYEKWQQPTTAALRGYEGKVKHILKKPKNRHGCERCDPVGSGPTLCCLFNVQTGTGGFNIFTVQSCAACNRGRTSPIYLHVVTCGGLLFVSALFNVEPVPPPVLADPTGSRLCRRAMLAAPTLRGWIRCVCCGERWLGVGSTEAGWALERAASCHSRSLMLLCSQGLPLHI